MAKTNFPMHSSLLLVAVPPLVTVFVLSRPHADAKADSQTQTLIDRICRQMEQYGYCNKVFNDNLKQPHSDMLGLGQIAVEQGALHANATYTQAQGLFDSETHPNLKEYYRSCVAGYNRVVVSYASALKYFVGERYNLVENAAKRAAKAEYLCEGFPGSTKMSGSNQEMRILIAMTATTAASIGSLVYRRWWFRLVVLGGIIVFVFVFVVALYEIESLLSLI